MKRNSTKRILLTAALSLTLLANAVPVCAADLDPAQPVAAPYTYLAQTGSAEELAPRMQYLSTVFTDLNLRNGKAYCQGNYTTFKNVKVTLTVTLQKSPINTDSEAYWSDVPGASWSQTWTGAGQNIISENKGDLAHYYYYRTKTTATVFNGVVPLETVIVRSQVSYYGG